MKKTLLFILVLLNFQITFAFQAKSEEETAQIDSQIIELLSQAEISVNVLNFEKAHDQLDKALKLSKQIGNQKTIALSSSILSQLYYIRHDYAKAITELERAISIQRQIEDESGLAYSFLNYSKLFHAIGDPERANDYLDQAQDYYEKHNDEESLGLVNLNRAVVTLGTDKTSETVNTAITYLNNAEVYLKDSNKKYELSRLHYFKSRAYLILRKSEEAKAEGLTALKIATENENGSMIMYTNVILSQIEELQKNYPASLNFLKRSNRIRDSIFDMNKEALAMEANTRYGVDAMRTSMNELAERNAEQERSLKVKENLTS